MGLSCSAEPRCLPPAKAKSFPGALQGFLWSQVGDSFGPCPVFLGRPEKGKEAWEATRLSPGDWLNLVSLWF